jgi:hypothetical protein
MAYKTYAAIRTHLINLVVDTCAKGACAGRPADLRARGAKAEVPSSVYLGVPDRFSRF